MSFAFGKQSERELVGVHPRLVQVVRKALTFSEVDFSVHDGLRTRDEQAEYVRRGVSHTLHSRHLKQKDGYGRAVDLVPYINGRLRWEWDPIFVMATAMRRAARMLLIDDGIKWGGDWKLLSLRRGVSMLHRQEDYVRECLDQGRRPFSDGPHFQLEDTF